VSATTYELPLNERMRTFLRLEFLFNQFEHAMAGNTDWDTRSALSGLLDIFSILTLTDLKKEVLKELERQYSYLGGLRDSPGVDATRLTDILEDIEAHARDLRNNTEQLGQELKSNDFLSSIAQRSGIPGGTCEFDLPAYHFWLCGSLEQRLADLRRWHSGIATIQSALRLILALTRQSAVPSREEAPGGFFQKSLNKDHPAQLVRVVVTTDMPYFAEISGGKHRFAVRFLEQPCPDDRPVQTEQTVSFQLACCAF
jgi:cell division protein ZapD